MEQVCHIDFIFLCLSSYSCWSSVSLPSSSVLCRRGNWITLKMRKLIKPKSRERMRSLTLTPSRSELGDGFLSCPQDSQDSSSIGSGSNSLDDTLTQKRSSSEYRGNTQTYLYIRISMIRVSTSTEGTCLAMLKINETNSLYKHTLTKQCKVNVAVIK